MMRNSDPVSAKIYQSGFAQAEETGIGMMAAVAEHDMIKHLDAHNLAGPDKLLSHLDVLGRRCWIAGGMVMGQNNGRAGMLKCPFEQLTRMDQAAVECPFADLLGFADQPVFGIEHQRPEYFV